MSQLYDVINLHLTDLTFSDLAEQVWIWENDEGSEFFFDVGEVVRFRVEAEEWHDQVPNAPELGDETPQERRPPYSILVSSVSPFPKSPILTVSRARCKWVERGPLHGGKPSTVGVPSYLTAKCVVLRIVSSAKQFLCSYQIHQIPIRINAFESFNDHVA